MTTDASLESLASAILASSRKGGRRVVALAGAPASGKSTLAERLADHLTSLGSPACVVPMDGFHLDNRILEARGLLHRKGAPETFDLAGFDALLARLPERREVIHPTFDRARDLAVAGAGLVEATCDTAIVEGNYLLLDLPGWRQLVRHWDFSVRVEVDMQTLRLRLIQRWRSYGLSETDAILRAESNDIPNAQLVLSNPVAADIIHKNTDGILL